MIKITKSIFITLIIICFTIISENTFAQRIDSSMYFNPIKDNIADKIPRMEALIDSAIANNPQIDFTELKAARVAYDIKSEQRMWTEHFGFEGEVKWGRQYWNDRDELTRLNDFYLTESRRFDYRVGFYIRFPLYYLIDRRNNINKKKKELEIEIIQREIKVKEIRKEVIREYNELMQQQNMLQISNDYQQTSIMMMQNAEVMFLNGEIPPEEYNRQKDYQTRGAQSYAQTLGRFNIAFTMLEELVGIKFNLINVLK